MKQFLKRCIFALLGKDPEAVVVAFVTGDPELCRRMAEQVRVQEPGRRHFTVTPENRNQMRQLLKRYRIGLALVMLGRQPNALRRMACRMAPRKILAFNSRLERHHLRLDLASFLFWRGVPLDRIYLRPWWWPWPRRDRSVVPAGYRLVEGRACSAQRRRVAVLSPYLPYPLSHGGAVRIYHLLRELSREFDLELFAFTEETAALPAAEASREPDPALLQLCARVVLVEKPRYREPRWSTLLPPEVCEFRSPAMRLALQRERAAFGFEALQVEYTQLAQYGGDALVEHDVTFDLFAQIARRRPSLSAWWDWFRWRRFERRAVRLFPRVVVMSKKDAAMLGPRAHCVVIENGVDLARFSPLPNPPASACCSSGPSATSRMSRPIVSLWNVSGRCWPASFPRPPSPWFAGRTI